MRYTHMRSVLIVSIAAFLCVSSAQAETALTKNLAGLAFLVGQWKSGDGSVADTGEKSAGTSTISVEADGNALLRRDHTDLFDKTGKATGSFSQIMVIYSDGGAVHADYVDGGGHAIHYNSAVVVAGKSVTFDSAHGAGPEFRLTYELKSPDALTVTFGMVPPGQTHFHAIATGTLERQP